MGQRGGAKLGEGGYGAVYTIDSVSYLQRWRGGMGVIWRRPGQPHLAWEAVGSYQDLLALFAGSPEPVYKVCVGRTCHGTTEPEVSV